jgi:uncharacterized repeat protein (TIGR03806 family)
MWKRLVHGVGVAVLCATAFSACTSNESKEGGNSSSSSDGGGVAPGEKAPPQRAEFGLDTRPPNATCIAPSRPPPSGAVKWDRAYENVNLEQTIAMAQPPGDKTRWFAASRTGKIVTFPAANPAAPTDATIVADLATLAGRPVQTEMEGGLLGFAIHPSFAQNGRIYVTWTTNEGGGPSSEVGYLTASNGGAPTYTYTKIFSFPRTRFEHCGGGIAFTKDGYLLLGFGDMANDTNGQRTPGFSSRILRLDVDHPEGGKAYGIPASNPYKNAPAGSEPPEVFAKGLRNPFRISIDRETGDIWVGDVGQDTYEEINRVELGGNYGWPCREGAHDYKATDTWLCPSTQGLIDPIVEHEHGTGGGRSITGGVVYRGNAIPGYQGTYVYGDFIKTELWALSNASTATPIATSTLLNEGGQPAVEATHFAEDDDGEIYVSSIINNRIYKLAAANPTAPSTFPDRLSKTGCFEPSDPKKPTAGLIPYRVNAALWSDGAEKERFLALPDGKTIAVSPTDGDFDLPIGSVLTKSFSIGGKLIETRLLVRHDDGEWAGYSYEWNDDQSDAMLLQSGRTKSLSGPGSVSSWTFPSRGECTRCHTAAAGRALGLEVGQLNGDSIYPTTNRLSNQLQTLEHIGMFNAPLGRPVNELIVYPDPFKTGEEGAAAVASLETRARAYLHANCSMCHRPNGGPERAPMDFRFSTPFADAKSCNVKSIIDDLGVPDAKILSPGKPEASLISLRVKASDRNRMPPLGTKVVDDEGAKLLDDWIRTTTCP